MTLNELINKLTAISKSLSDGIELYIDNTKKVSDVEVSTGNNGNRYINITTKNKK